MVPGGITPYPEPLECHWSIQYTLGCHWVTQRILAAQIAKFMKMPHTGMPLETISAYTGTPLGGLQQPTHTQTHIVKRSSSFCQFEMKTNLAIPVYAYWEVTWHADLQTRCCQYTGIPLGRLHWIHTGWCYHANGLPRVFQWQSRAHLHNWNTLEDQWSHKYIGMPLEPHWLMLAHSGVSVAIQCSGNLHNWNTPEDHWGHTHSQTTPWASSYPILHTRAGWLPLGPASCGMAGCWQINSISFYWNIPIWG